MNKKIYSKFFEKTIFLLKFLLPFIVVVIIWELIGQLQIIDQLPLPSQLIVKFYELTFEKDILIKHLSSSLYRLIIGYILAVVFGILVGVLIGIKKSISDMFSPILSLLIAIPTIAWVPLLLITLGLSDETVIAAIFLGGFFAIAFSTMHGIRSIDKSMIKAAKTMGSSELNLFIHVLLPGSLVSLIPGLRLAIGYSWRALVGAEMLAAMIRWGIGKMIYTARFWNDVKLMFLGLVIIGLTGLILDRLIMGIIEEKTIKRWGMVTEGE